MYINEHELSIFSWLVEVAGPDPVKIHGPGFNGILNPGDRILQGFYVFFSDITGQRLTKYVKYRSTEPLRTIKETFIFRCDLFSKEYGRGIEFAHFDTVDKQTNRSNGRAVWSFPAIV